MTITIYIGVLHTWNSNLRNKRFRRARDTRAQSFAYPSSRVPQWLLEPLHRHNCHTVGVAIVCRGHLFASQAQLQRTAEKRYAKVYARAGLERHPPAHKMGDLSRLVHMPARYPHDSGSSPCIPRKSSASRARPTLLEHPSISSTVTVGEDIIADSVSLLNVASGMIRT